jgi:hypothetical protein
MSNCYNQQEAILGESNTAGTTIPAMPSVLGHSYWIIKRFGGLHWGINKLGDVNQQAILCKMQIPLGPEMADYSRYPSTEYFLVTD